MNVSFSGKFGGWITILSGLFLAVAHSIDFFAGGNGTIFSKVLVFLAHLFLVFSFIGIYEAQSRKNGFWGTAGMLLAIIGTIVVDCVVLVEMAEVSGAEVKQVFTHQPALFISTNGPLLFVFGMIFTGISIVKNNLLPRLGGWMLIAGTVLFALGTVAGSLSALFVMIGAVVTGISFIRLGASFSSSYRNNTVTHNITETL